MSLDFTLVAQIKTDLGKGASRRLRHQGRVPGIMYGAGKEPIMLTFAHNDLMRATADEAFFSHVLTVDVDGAKDRAILKDMQRHPAMDNIMHIDLQRVDENKVIHVHVPLHFINENISSGVKMGGIVSHLKTEIEIACLPKDLPEYIEVDIAGLELNASIHLSDIIVSDALSIIELTHGEEHDLPVASINLPRGEKVSDEDEDEVESDANEDAKKA